MQGLWNNVPQLTEFELESQPIEANHRSPEHVAKVAVPLSHIFRGSQLPLLRQLVLRSFWLESQDLYSLVSRHASTLEELSFHNINIGGTPQGPAANVSAVRIVGMEVPRFYLAHDNGSLEGWKQVMRECQGISGLRDLSVKDPTVGRQFESMSVFDMEDLAELRTNGRANIMVSEAAGWLSMFD